MLNELKQFIAKPLPHKVLFFDEMLTPKVIRLAYWLCLLVIVWTGLCRMFSDGFAGFVSGAVYIIVSCILARIGAELVILLFKLNENIETVASNTKPSSTKRKVAKKVTKK